MGDKWLLAGLGQRLQAHTGNNESVFSWLQRRLRGLISGDE